MLQPTPGEVCPVGDCNEWGLGQLGVLVGLRISTVSGAVAPWRQFWSLLMFTEVPVVANLRGLFSSFFGASYGLHLRIWLGDRTEEMPSGSWKVYSCLLAL